MKKLVVDNSDLKVTQQVADVLGKYIDKEPFLCFLQGNLGAGKTTLMRYFLASLGYTGKVKSPTFTIVETYDLPKFQINHFDLYRIADPEELYFIGIDEYLSSGINVVEWPEKAQDILSFPDLVLELKLKGDKRSISFSSDNKNNIAKLEQLLKDAGISVIT